MPFNSVRACPENSKKAPPERKDFPRSGGRCHGSDKKGRTGSNFWHRKRKAVFGQYNLFKTSTFFLHHLLLLPVSVQEPGEYSRRKTNNLLLQEFIL